MFFSLTVQAQVVTEQLKVTVSKCVLTAKENKAKRIDLYVDNKNTHAIKVYEKAGYRKLKNHGKTRMLYVKYVNGNIATESNMDLVFKW